MKIKGAVIGILLLLSYTANAAPAGLTKVQIQTIVQKNVSAVLACYDKELVNSPHLKGKIVLAFDVGLDGEITSVSFSENTLKNKLVEACIVENCKTWAFPKTSEMVHVKYPFAFDKRDQK